MVNLVSLGITVILLIVAVFILASSSTNFITGFQTGLSLWGDVLEYDNLIFFFGVVLFIAFMSNIMQLSGE